MAHTPRPPWNLFLVPCTCTYTHTHTYTRTRGTVFTCDMTYSSPRTHIHTYIHSLCLSLPPAISHCHSTLSLFLSRARIHIYSHTHTRPHTQTHTQTHTHTHSHTHTHAHTHTQTQTQIHKVPSSHVTWILLPSHMRIRLSNMSRHMQIWHMWKRHNTHIYLSCLTRECVISPAKTAQGYGQKSVQCDTRVTWQRHPYIFRFPFGCLIHMCDHDSLAGVSWLIHMCAMTHSHVCHDSFTLPFWMPYSYVWPWLTRRCAMTHSHVCHDSFTCVPWLIHMCAMTHSHVCHDPFTCVPW